MAKTSAKRNSQDDGERQPRSLKFATNGIKTDHDFANLMAGLMSDLIEGRISPSVGNATCNAGGKLLKVVEMRYRYGVAGPGNLKTLTLTLEELPAGGATIVNEG